ncbi:MAG: carboxypeptidase-like regulatory domain-containing protein, partial [Chloroflexi bacterium]|nr:carboxypeptidase-like regulatory domain-containing protein [Chloroflexota bacterium]
AVTTDATGRAQATFTLGTRAGVADHVVEASAVGFAGPAVFAASATPGPPALVVVDSGGLQVGVASRELPRPLVAAVVDAAANRLPDVPLTFRVTRGAGRFADGTQETVVSTDSDGRAIVTLTLDPNEGIANNIVEARLGEVDGPVAGFVASGRAIGDPAQTSISGVVLDNTNLAIAGVTLRVKETSLVAVSDAQGQFRITGAPVGAVKLVVDGSTASRPGSWPDLEFDLVTIAGRDTTVNMPIYLLPITLEQGLYVDETRGGTLTLPDFPGFALEIQPGSVIFPGGSRSGLVSATVVHNDKVPMVPNFGQQPRFIVTIQPAGARFEPPARLSLPNVEGFAPGTVIEQYS